MCYTARQYDTRVKRLVELEALKADLEKQINAIEADIQQDMGDTEEVVTPRFRIKYQTVISQRFDGKSFKAAHEDIYKKYLKPSTCKRFTYTAV